MFDPVKLRSFLAVAQARSFTQAARRLGLRQSTVSQHVLRLERDAGRRLLERDTHSVRLTDDGEAMVGFATAILDATDRATRHFAGAPLHGLVRFGVSEDLVQTELPDILRAFRRSHPGVELNLTVALSGALYQRLDHGELDLFLAKRAAADGPGRLLWRDRFVWVGAPETRLDPVQPVPLVVYPPPSISRARAITALTGAGLDWRIACVSGSLAGLRAAAMVGQGVLAHAAGLVPPGLVRLHPRASHLPDLGDVEFVLAGRDDVRGDRRDDAGLGDDGPDDDGWARGGPVAALRSAILSHGRWRAVAG